jgi:hypothetical protein
VSVLGLIHVNKSTGADLLTRLMASRAFSAVARAVLFCARDTEVPEAGLEPDQGETFMFGQPKNNLAARVAHTLRYRIVGRQVGWDDELQQPVYGSRIDWAGRRDERIDDAVERQETAPSRRDSAHQRAMAWLEANLDQRCDSSEVKDKAAIAGHSVATIKRAARELGVVVEPDPANKRRTFWSLPDDKYSEARDNRV